MSLRAPFVLCLTAPARDFTSSRLSCQPESFFGDSNSQNAITSMPLQSLLRKFTTVRPAIIFGKKSFLELSLASSLIEVLAVFCKHFFQSSKATIIRCDLSSRFFCIGATLLCKFESDKI